MRFTYILLLFIELLLMRLLVLNCDDSKVWNREDGEFTEKELRARFDALDGDITAQLAMALHQVAKEPLFSIGSTILPTVPIVEAIGSAPPQSGAWGQHGAMDPVALGSAAVDATPSLVKHLQHLPVAVPGCNLHRVALEGVLHVHVYTLSKFVTSLFISALAHSS